jgi:crossover junction endodeoxyribonuclease RusA
VKAKIAKKYRADCMLATRASGAVVDWDGDVHLWITFFPPDRRRRDDDNIIGSLKNGRDGVADALGIDDSRFRSHPYVSDQVRKGGAVEIKLTKGPA